MADLALGWLLSRPGVRGVIAGVRDAGQTAANAAAAAREIPAEVLARLDRATGELRSELGEDPDPWRMPDNSRFA